MNTTSTRQRIPSPKQASNVIRQITNALISVQHRTSERKLDIQKIIFVAQQATKIGQCQIDGGRVTARSYKYPWSTTIANAHHETNGTVSVSIGRLNGWNKKTENTQQVNFADKWWHSISADSSILMGGGNFAIRRRHGWDCYDLDGNLVGVTIPVKDKQIASRWSKWEHGKTIDDALAEIAHKRNVLDNEVFEKVNSAKRERAARLLTRIGVKTLIGYDDARSVGACDIGIREFGNRIGITDISAKIPLTEISKIEPIWALKLARKLVRKSVHWRKSS